MNIHYFQHVPFEGLGSIEKWVTQNHHILTVTRFFKGETPPPLDTIDGLIIMGGPMSVHDSDQYPWLVTEKQFIQQAITHYKPILGICLGAQLIAEVLGATVYPNTYKEIGWSPIEKMANISKVTTLFPDQLTVFQWHGETFTLPVGAIQLMRSIACEHQAFIYNDRVMALQFHLEATQETVEQLVKQCHDELIEAPYIQTAEVMLASHDYFTQINKIMNHILDDLMITTLR